KRGRARSTRHRSGPMPLNLLLPGASSAVSRSSTAAHPVLRSVLARRAPSPAVLAPSTLRAMPPVEWCPAARPRPAAAPVSAPVPGLVRDRALVERVLWLAVLRLRPRLAGPSARPPAVDAAEASNTPR